MEDVLEPKHSLFLICNTKELQLLQNYSLDQNQLHNQTFYVTQHKLMGFHLSQYFSTLIHIAASVDIADEVKSDLSARGHHPFSSPIKITEQKVWTLFYNSH